MTRWTEEQQRAIVLKNRRLLISAAAGSGKTAVLTERIIQRITDPADAVDIEELLVMTFTRAAASEMRERIRRRLEERLQSTTSEQTNSTLHQRLQRQLALMDAAKITTIDSFCLSILREHADLTELDPAFRVGNEEELALLKNDVADTLLEECFAAGEEAFEHFAEGFSQGKTEKGLTELLLSLYQFSESAPWPEEWLESCLREAEQSAGDVRITETTAWMQYLLSEVRGFAAALVKKAEEALLLCGEEGGPSGYENTVRTELRGLERMTEVHSFSELQEVLRIFSSWQMIGRNPKSTMKEKAEAAKALRDFWKSGVQKIAEQFGGEAADSIAADLVSEAETVRTLISLVREFGRRYAKKKRERNLIDFSDLEHMALSLLWEKQEDGSRRRTALAEEYAESFREIYVDEYQDSNGVQEALLSAIERGSVFLVGDVKQSVYGFRQARPELFTEKYERYRKYTEETPVPEGADTRVDLRKNFRSRHEVLDTANGIFSRLMDRPVGGIVYDSDAALYCGAIYPENPQDDRSYQSELLLAETAEDADESKAETEARLIAERIRELTDPASDFRVTDSGSGALRRAEYRDMVILLRAVSGQAEEFINVLMSEGIPAQAEQRTGYFSALEVKTTLSLLSAIDNPLLDIPLAAVLCSPIGGLSGTELACLTAEAEQQRKQREEESRGEGDSRRTEEFQRAENAGSTLFERLCGVQNSNQYPEAAEKLRRIFCFLEESAEKALYMSLPELIREVLETSGYGSYAAALPGGEVRSANLQMLIVKAGDFERTGYRGLYDFVRYIELLKKYDTDYGEASAEAAEGNVVRIMTVHKSKGLEFPVVFLAGTGRKFNLRDSSAGVVADQDFGIAAEAVDLSLHTKGSTLKKNVLAWHMRTQLLGEELRVLYVAMTRAKEKLILTAALRDADKALQELRESIDTVQPGSADIRAAGSYLDWILLAMRGDPERCGIRTSVRKAETAAAEAEQREAQTAELRRRLMQIAEASAGPEQRSCFRWLNYPYPYEEDVTLYSKRSVSELKYRGQDEDDAFAFRKYSTKDAAEGDTGDAVEGVTVDTAEAAEGMAEAFSAEKTEQTGEEALQRAAMRGIAVHRVMEKLDYGALPPCGKIGEYLDSLTEQGILSGEERAILREEDLETFLQSPLCRRMEAAWQKGTLHREAQFVMALPAKEVEPERSSEEPVVIQGIIDAWFEEDGEIVLVDYKTDRGASAELLAERYRPQLALYARALGMMEQKRVSARLLWSFARGEAICL